MDCHSTMAFFSAGGQSRTSCQESEALADREGAVSGGACGCGGHRSDICQRARAAEVQLEHRPARPNRFIPRCGATCPADAGGASIGGLIRFGRYLDRAPASALAEAVRSHRQHSRTARGPALTIRSPVATIRRTQDFRCSPPPGQCPGPRIRSATSLKLAPVSRASAACSA